MVFGSFLNVVVYRVPARISLNRESRCPVCATPIKPWQNVPVLGWLVLRGKAACCGAPIAARYPLVEAFTGLVFAVATAVTLWAVGTPGPKDWVVLAVVLVVAMAVIVLTLIRHDARAR